MTPEQYDEACNKIYQAVADLIEEDQDVADVWNLLTDIWGDNVETFYQYLISDNPTDE